MLSWHVDYWNKLKIKGKAWVDPYSSERATKRQKAYRKARGLKNMWTPQLVVDNQVLRGWGGVRDAIDAARKKKSAFTIDAGAALAEGFVSCSARMGVLGTKRIDGSAEVLFVLFRRKVSTEVPTGENGGKTLVEYQVVLETSAPQRLGQAVSDKGVRARFRAPAGVAAKELGVALLVEDREKMKTLDCVTIDVAG